VLFEVFGLSANGLIDRHQIDNLLLRTTFDAVVAELKRVNLSLKQFERVCAFVHQVNFSQNADGSFTLGVNLTSKF
jgi:hypothetical protein